MISIHQKYIISKFLISLSKVLLIFSFLIFLMSLLEELSFFSDIEGSMLTILSLTLINTPSILFEIFPFIFLTGTIYFFMDILDKGEIYTLKILSISNIKILTTICVISFFIGVFLITFFYHLSTNLRFVYLEKKNNFSKDDKYLAVVTSNGLWIRDKIDNNLNFINADKINENYLINIFISSFNKNLDLQYSIKADQADIKTGKWELQNVTFNSNNEIKKYNNIQFNSNFDVKKINSLFEDLSSLSLIELMSLEEDYKLLGYSTDPIKILKHKIYSYPLYLAIMAAIGAILMLRIKYNKKKIFHIIIGVLLSVLIYYMNHFSKIIIESQNLSFIYSTWGPQILLLTLVSINLVRLNEK